MIFSLRTTVVVFAVTALIIGSGIFSPQANASTATVGGAGEACGRENKPVRPRSLNCPAGEVCLNEDTNECGVATSTGTGPTGGTNQAGPTGGTNPNSPGGTDYSFRLQSPIEAQSFQELLEALINLLLLLSAPILTALIVVAGFLYLFSGADASRRQTANNIIKYGIIGFIVIIFARAIVAVVQGIVS